MYEFANAKDITGIPFTILDEPVRIYKTNSNWWNEKGYEANEGFQKFMTFYLADETKNPFDKIKTEEGKEVGNLVTFDAEGEKKYVDYNFFNYRAPVERQKEDGTVEQYRRKWLDGRTRVNVKLLKPTTLDVWDTASKKEMAKKVEYVKLDIPLSAWAKILDKHLTFKEAKEDPKLPLSALEVAIEFDKSKAAPEMYSTKVKLSKEKLDIEKELTNFESRRAEFVPPENPFN